MSPQNLYREHARKYIKKRYPKYRLSFGAGKIRRLVSTFHASWEGHHIVGEVHNRPQTTRIKMESALERIEEHIGNLGIERQKATILIFAPRPPKEISTRVWKAQQEFRKDKKVRIVGMPRRDVIRRRVRKLKERARKAKMAKN